MGCTMRRFLKAIGSVSLSALLIAHTTPVLAQVPAPVREGPLQIQNNLNEIQQNGTTAQATARSNLGITGTGGGSGGGSDSSIATGSITSRLLADRALDVGVNVMDFGALGDGFTDDSHAINLAMTYAKTNYYWIGSGALSNGDDKKGFTLYFPPGHVYLIQAETLNWTMFINKGMHVSARGATLLGRTAGKPVVDMTGCRWCYIDGLQISTDSTNTPSIGIKYQRSGRGAGDSACSNAVWSNILVNGPFTFAPIYISGCETTKYINVYGFNTKSDATNGANYGVVLDGVNHFNFGSEFTTPTVPMTQDAFVSFNEPNFYGLMATNQSSCATCAAMWISGTSRATFVGSYAATQSPQCFMLYSKDSTNLINDFRYDGLCETTGTLPTDILLTGPNTTPTLNGFEWHVQASNARTNWIATDTGIVSVSGSGMRIEINGLQNNEVFFANPALWNISGDYRVPSGSTAWNLADSQFNGRGVNGQVVTFYGDGSKLTGVIASGGGTGGGTVVTTGTVYAMRVQNAGSLANLILNTPQSTHGGQYSYDVLGGTFPTVTIGAPAAGGTQATAVVTSMGIFSTSRSNLIPNVLGSGYVNGQTLTAIGGTVAPGGSAFKMILTVVGGVITAVSPSGTNAYSVLPPSPLTFTGDKGNVGSGASLSNLTVNVTGVALTANGAGYLNAPLVTFQQGTGSGSSTATATAVLSTGLALASNTGGGEIDLLPDRVNLGVNASPVVTLGADHHSAVTFVASAAVTNGATQAMPANTDAMVLRNAALVASQTVLLPPITGIIGQIASISSLSGIATLSMQTATGVAVPGAPSQLVAGGGSITFKSDGTVWVPVSNDNAAAPSATQSDSKYTVRPVTSGSTDTAPGSDGSISKLLVSWESNSGAQKTETVPACGSLTGGMQIKIKDAFGDADRHNILIVPTAGTVEKQASFLISGIFGSLELICQPSASNWTIN